MKCPNCNAENMNSSKFCKHCGEKFLQGQDQIVQTARANHNKTTLLAIGFAVLAIVAVAGYFIGRGDKKIEKKSTMNNKTPAYSQSDLSADNRARLASFRATTVSNNPAAMMCGDESKLSTTSYLSGSNICSDTDVEDGTYSSPANGVCDEGAYGIEVTDTTPADGVYKFVMTCTIAGTEYTTTCDQTICSTTP